MMDENESKIRGRWNEGFQLVYFIHSYI